MVKMMWIVPLAGILLSGCDNDNPELASAIYQRYKGVSRCPICLENIREAVEREHKASVSQDVHAMQILDPQKIYEAHKIFEAQNNILPDPIVKIKTSKTDFDNVWKAQVSVKCETHGTLVSKVSEWSFKDKKLRLIK